MPWCDHCSRYLSPSTVHVDGACPACGHAVDPGKARAPSATPAAALGGAATAEGQAAVASDDAPLPVPWHLKLMAGALAVYLGYRFLQMGEWLWHALS